MGSIVPAVALDHPSGKPGQSCVPASFLNDMCTVAALVHPGIEIFLFQKLVQRLGPGKILDLGIICTIEKVCRV